MEKIKWYYNKVHKFWWTKEGDNHDCLMIEKKYFNEKTSYYNLVLNNKNIASFCKLSSAKKVAELIRYG